MSQFFSDSSFPERNQDDPRDPGRSTIGCRNGTYATRLASEQQEYAARFYQDILNASTALGWEWVNSLIVQAQAESRR